MINSVVSFFWSLSKHKNLLQNTGIIFQTIMQYTGY